MKPRFALSIVACVLAAAAAVAAPAVPAPPPTPASAAAPTTPAPAPPARQEAGHPKALPAPDATAERLPVSKPVTADEVRNSILATDSLQVSRLEIDVFESTDSTGQKQTDLRTKRVAIRRAYTPWIERFAAALLPRTAEIRADKCPTPVAIGGASKPWECSVLWVNHTGRGQAYVDFSSGCAYAGLAGADGPRTGSLKLGPAQLDSLFALFQQALPRDSAFQKMDRHAPGAAPAPGATDALPAFGENILVDTAPEPVTRVAPVYPEAARKAKMEGEVRVAVLVDREGNVRDTRVTESLPGLDDAAVAAVKQWHFKPATDHGRPVAVWAGIPVRFSLAPAGAKPDSAAAPH